MKSRSATKRQKAGAKIEQKAKKLEKKTLVKSKGKKSETLPIKEDIKVPTIEFKVDLIDGKKEVTLHSKYTIDSTHNLFTKIDKLVQELKSKEKRKDNKIFKVVQFSYYPTFEFQLQGLKPDHDKCCICQFEFSDRDYEKELQNQQDEDIVQLKCSHMIHIGCLRGLIGDKEWIRCPVCFTIFGVMIGDQPFGTMSWNIIPTLHCDGYPDVGTITIRYQMNGGNRNGVPFHGTSRTAYLPDNSQGNQVLRLLKIGFDRKLIFTVGTSVTTGMDNCVVWNGIHHKTHTHGGSSRFGYPDPTYFDRVKLELAAKGVY